MKYAWIVSNKAHWPITLACEVLGVSASGYFEHGRRKKAPKPSKPDAHKRMSDEALLAHIRAIHAEVKGEYGWPKMWKELVARGHRVGKERVRRLTQLHGIRAGCKRKFVVTTDSKHHLPIAPDLVQRNFTPTAPNQIWTGDITYIAADEGWLYLAAVSDLFSRQVVGWSMQPCEWLRPSRSASTRLTGQSWAKSPTSFWKAWTICCAYHSSHRLQWPSGGFRPGCCCVTVQRTGWCSAINNSPKGETPPPWRCRALIPCDCHGYESDRMHQSFFVALFPLSFSKYFLTVGCSKKRLTVP